MSIEIKKGGTSMLKIETGYTFSFNFERNVMVIPTALINKVWGADLKTTTKNFTINADLNTTTTNYASLSVIKTKIDELFPEEQVEYSIVDSEGIWNVSKCFIENVNGGETFEKVESISVNIKVLEITDNMFKKKDD